LNGNGLADPEEDVNGPNGVPDGNFNAWDCRGADGTDGTNGTNGTNGLSCWDLNGNGLADPEEDVSGPEGVPDGNFNAWDCRGANGGNGANGLNCWDLNGNGIADPEEDVSGPDGVPDGVVDVWDCRGATGEPGQDLTGVGHGVVDAGGNLVDGYNIIGASRDQNEYGFYYTVEVDVSSVPNLPELTADDFSVLATVRAVSADPYGGGAIALLVAHYQFFPGALDVTNGTLTVRVYIMDLSTFLPTAAEFSILVLEP
jgi:hypothetical protein